MHCDLFLSGILDRDPCLLGRDLCVKGYLQNVEHTELIDALGSDVLKMDKTCYSEA